MSSQKIVKNSDPVMKRAGLLLFQYNEKGELLFRCMVPSDADYGGISPQIPKGCVDNGYNERETAIKEAMEEAGLLVSNIAWVAHFKQYAKMKISMFIGQVKDVDAFGDWHYETEWSGWINYDQDRAKIRDIQVHIFDEVADFARVNHKA